MGLYHFKTGFPKLFNAKVGTIPLSYTRHARQAALDDRCGLLTLPSLIETNSALCIEAEVVDGRVFKLVYRVTYNASLDICLVVVPDGIGFKVLTVWANAVDDLHGTLDCNNYSVA